MYQNIAQAGKTLPIHFRVHRPEVIRYVLYGLTDDLAISDYRVSGSSVGKEIIQSHASDEIGDKTHCHYNMAYEGGHVTGTHIGTASL